ncbi:MAG TPA: Ig-like domain repeat protein, partial [Acidimicrobiales bacterium]
MDSGNILSKLQLTFDSSSAGSPSCTGGSGLGTTASPYVGATLCTVPYNAQLESDNYSFYNVAPLDYNLPGSQLNDTVTFTWQSLCSTESGMSCPVGNQPTTTGGSVLVQQLTADTSTMVLNSSDTPVATVAVGTPVHDSVTVVPDATDPTPTPTITGNVTINWFTNGGCTGTANATSSPQALPASGKVDATGFSFTPTAGGQYSFQATYNGDTTNPAYAASTGACEPLTVVDANISIAPLTATNPVGATHTFTITVNQNKGAGFVAAPDGTKPTLSLVNTSGAGATITGGTCGSAGTVSGTCTITISSPTTGVTMATASVTLTVGGISLTRTTNGPDTSGDSAPATKNWVAATSSVVTNIQQGGQTVTSVSSGTSVTDLATVSGSAGGASPTGTVTFTFFTNATCTGKGTAAGKNVTLVGGMATSNSEGPFVAGSYAFQATYSGDTNYKSSTGACEPLTVQGPQLSITKTADATPVSTGTSIGFSVTISNATGPNVGTATGVAINDPLPAG